jgi:hypothetical protein
MIVFEGPTRMVPTLRLQQKFYNALLAVQQRIEGYSN